MFLRLIRAPGRGASFLVTLVFLSLAVISAGQNVQIAEFRMPALGMRPIAITTGPDGALWFTATVPPWQFPPHNIIGRITTSGIITEYPLGPNTRPDSITVGPDGALWFTAVENNGDCDYYVYYGSGCRGKIGRMTTSGVITEFSVPVVPSWPQWIISGPDGALWFNAAGIVWRVTTTGTFRPMAPASGPLAAGPDGAVWVFGYTGTNYGFERVTTGAAMRRYETPSIFDQGRAITVGSDNAIWAANAYWHLGRMSTTGTFTYGPAVSHSEAIFDLTTGPDGALWFTVQNPYTSARIGRAAPISSGAPGASLVFDTREYAVPTSSVTLARFITVGPDGNLWFTEEVYEPSSSNTGRIGRLIVDQRDTSKPVSRVAALEVVQPAPSFPVRWSGTDTGTGIQNYTIYVSDNGGPFNPWLTFTPGTGVIFPGQPLHAYAFYSIARDRAGNQEDPKMFAEAITRTPEPKETPSPVGDLNGDGQVDCLDVAIVKASFGKTAGQPGFDTRADVNRDGKIDVRDLAFVAQQFSDSRWCP